MQHTKFQTILKYSYNHTYMNTIMSVMCTLELDQRRQKLHNAIACDNRQ